MKIYKQLRRLVKDKKKLKKALLAAAAVLGASAVLATPFMLHKSPATGATVPVPVQEMKPSDMAALAAFGALPESHQRVWLEGFTDSPSGTSRARMEHFRDYLQHRNARLEASESETKKTPVKQSKTPKNTPSTSPITVSEKPSTKGNRAKFLPPRRTYRVFPSGPNKTNKSKKIT